MIEAVVCDIDDTLCSTEAAAFELENDVLSKMGRSPMERTIHLETWGSPLEDAILLRSPGVDFDTFVHLYGQSIPEYVARGKLDAIPETNYHALDRLTAAGRLAMVLTARTEMESRHMLVPSHPLASRLTDFYHKGNTLFHKPDPRVFDELFAKHDKLQPERCVYVGDSVGDAQAATAAGVLFIASMESGLRSKADFAAYKPAAYIDRFAELPEAVFEIERTHS